MRESSIKHGFEILIILFTCWGLHHCLFSFVEQFTVNICGIVVPMFRLFQQRNPSCLCLILNSESDNTTVLKEIVSMTEQWIPVCFPERDLAHEGNQPFVSSLHKALINSQRLIVVVSKEFIQDKLLIFFLKSHVVYEMSEGTYRPENVLFIILDETKVPRYIAGSFAQSEFLRWRTFSMCQKRIHLLKWVLSYLIEELNMIVSFSISLYIMNNVIYDSHCNPVFETHFGDTVFCVIYFVVDVIIRALITTKNSTFVKSNIICLFCIFIFVLVSIESATLFIFYQLKITLWELFAANVDVFI